MDDIPVPTDPYEAAVHISARIESLARIYANTLNEVAELQATVEAVSECVKTLMVERGISLRKELTPEQLQLRSVIDSEYEDAYKFYRTESIKRLQSFDGPLVVEPEKPDSEH